VTKIIWLCAAALVLAGCLTKSADIIECRKLCYPAQAITPPLNGDRGDASCRCLWPASMGDAGVTEAPKPTTYKESNL
jgi:hypothetical protein